MSVVAGESSRGEMNARRGAHLMPAFPPGLGAVKSWQRQFDGFIGKLFGDAFGQVEKTFLRRPASLSSKTHLAATHQHGWLSPLPSWPRDALRGLPLAPPVEQKGSQGLSYLGSALLGFFGVCVLVGRLEICRGTLTGNPAPPSPFRPSPQACSSE